MPYFGYEYNWLIGWCPVIYPDNMPDFHLISDTEAALGLDLLQRLYSLDPEKQLINETIRRNKEERTKKMVRPVEGFITSQGKFFDTEAKANLYETNILMREVFMEVFGGGEMVTSILDVIKAHHELVSEYIQAVKAVIQQTTADRDAGEPTGSQSSDGEGGQPTVDHPSDDRPVWEQESIPVGEAPPAEEAFVSDGEAVEHGVVQHPDSPNKRRKR